MDYKIEITADQPRGVMSALSAAVSIAKVLNLDSLSIDAGGINIIAFKDSRVVDLFNIYQKEIKIRELEIKLDKKSKKRTL